MSTDDKLRLLIAAATVVIFIGVNFLMLSIKIDKLEAKITAKGDTTDASKDA